MPQFFVPPKNVKGNYLFFDSSESRHLVKVLRKKEGDVINVFDGENPTRLVKLTDCSNSNKIIGLIIPSPLEGEGKGEGIIKSKRIHLHIYPALIKNDRFEWMIEKLTEIGVTSIHPVITERTIIHIDPKKINSKLERWEKIILSSAKQCGRTDLPKIFPPVSFSEALKSCHFERSEKSCSLILWENEEEKVLSQYIYKNISSPLMGEGKGGGENKAIQLSLFLGPEGGYTFEEIERAQSAGVVPVGLGNQILRAETAAIAAASVILI